MKTLNKITIALLTLVTLGSCQRDDVEINTSGRYIKFLGGVAEDKAHSFTSTTDGGFILIGTQDQLGSESGSFFLASLDENGNYKKTLVLEDTINGEIKNSEGHDIAQLINGNYLALGQCTMANDSLAYLVLEIDQQLNIISRDTIAAEGINIVGRKIVVKDNGDCWLTGETVDFNEQDKDLYYVVRASDGTYTSHKQLGIIGSNDNMGNIIGLSDNTTIWCGTLLGNSSDDALRTFKVDENGGILFDFFFKKFNLITERGHDVAEGGDGNLYHVGQKSGNGYVVVTQTNGAIIQEFEISDGNGDLVIYGISPTSSGHFLLTGKVSTSSMKEQAFLFRMNSNGNIDLKKYFGGPEDDTGEKVIELSDKTYVILGTSTIATGNKVLTFIHTDSNGEVFGENF